MNFRIISRLIEIGIIIAFLIISMDYIIPVYFPHEKSVAGNHVYLGEIYDGKEMHANEISFQVSVSKDYFKSDYIIYSVISTWDSNGSYDQIGVSSINGQVYATYSYTTSKNNTIVYEFNPKWFPIGVGNYSGFMNISQGVVKFSFDHKVLLAKTGGNYFILSKFFKNENNSYAGTTIYEEIYNFKWKLPPIDFNFTKIYEDNAPLSTWTIFIHNLTENYTSYIFQYENSVNIYGELPYILTGYSYITGNYGFEIADFQVHLASGEKYTLMLIPNTYTYEIFSLSNSSLYRKGIININGNTWFNITS